MTVGMTISDFDGFVGRISGPVMARLNRDMEQTVVTELSPSPSDSVLAIGFGPGIGIELLAEVLSVGLVAGIDPSATMNDLARRRNRRRIDSGHVVLRNASVEAIPWPDDTFDGIVAANSAVGDRSMRPLEKSPESSGPAARLSPSLMPGPSRRCRRFRSGSKGCRASRRRREFSAISSQMRTFRSGRGLILRAVAFGEPTWCLFITRDDPFRRHCSFIGTMTRFESIRHCEPGAHTRTLDH